MARHEFKFVVSFNPETGNYDTDIEFPTDLMERAKNNAQVMDFSNCLTEVTRQLCKMVSIYS